MFLQPLSNGIFKAIQSFSLITIPSYLTYFGTNAHQLDRENFKFLYKLSYSLFALNLVSSVGQEFAPVFCAKSKVEFCKSAARISSYAVQTTLFGQHTETGLLKGLTAEMIGFNLPGFIISELVGTASEPAIDKIYQNYNNSLPILNEAIELSKQKLVKNALGDAEVAYHFLWQLQQFTHQLLLTEDYHI